MDSVGVHHRTGRVVTDWDHVVASIEDLLTTRKLSRVMLRDYGSDFPELVDAPMTDLSLVLFYSAVATAIELWEPRFELDDIAFLEAGPDGRTTLRLTGQYLPRGHLGDRTPAETRSAAYVSTAGAFVALT